MPTEVIEAVVTLIGFFGGSSLIGGLLMKRIDKLERKLDRREQDRVNESVLTGGCMSACEKLTEANTGVIRTLAEDNVCEQELTGLMSARARLDEFRLAKSSEYLHA